MKERSGDEPLWVPAPNRAASSRLSEFARRASDACGRALVGYPELHDWSLQAHGEFWSTLWDFGEVIGDKGSRHLVNGHDMLEAGWFPDARLNYAENLLRKSANGDALVFWGEDKIQQNVSRDALRAAVARFAAALQSGGVGAGDRVGAYMPNLPETLVAMLATVSIGAVFTSVSPDFGVQGAVDRFGQTEPKVLVSVDGYWYNGKVVDMQPKLAELMRQLGSVRRLVLVPYLEQGSGTGSARKLPFAVSYQQFVSPHMDRLEPRYVRLPFDHPLFILYSSGTTGVPKCIVHGAGGTLLQHIKEHQLHADLRAGDRFFYYTTCGWMMWNWLASGLASGATLMLYDGNPFVRDGRILWDFAEKHRCTHFGTSAKYIESLSKSEIRPARSHRLDELRVVLSTGSPLAPRHFDFVHESVSQSAQLSSISGGTDIVSCFMLGNPTLPVWRGEIQCAGLGMAVEVWNEDGKPVIGEQGELVCVKPFPSRPVAFWNDPDRSKYTAAYFQRFPGVWCHGDYCEATEHGGYVIHGRSDATLNPGGVRIGTAEIYRQVDGVPEVIESVVIGQEWPAEEPTDVRVVLFVRLREGAVLDGDLEARIRKAIRDNASPRHVPDRIVQVTGVPRTRSGKLVELAVRDVVHGRPVRNLEALANAEVLHQFGGRAELRT